MDYGRKYILWELFAGEGRVSKTAARRSNMQSERFSLVDGWDFAQASHRMAFLRRLRPEEPDCVLISPMCKLWSSLQELTCAAHEGYAETLDIARQWDHGNILMFFAGLSSSTRGDRASWRYVSIPNAHVLGRHLPFKPWMDMMLMWISACLV